MEWLAQNKDLAAAVSDWVQAIAFAAGALGIWRYFYEKRLARRNAARDLYTSFMNSSILHPELYGGAWTDQSLQTKTAQQKYVYYMGSFLWAAEELLREFPKDASWEETILVTAREHRDYFHSNQFTTEKAGYSPYLIRLLGKVTQDA